MRNRHRRSPSYTRPSMSVVTFLSDYGLQDDFVGVCHGVIARIAPRARILEIELDGPVRIEPAE